MVSRRFNNKGWQQKRKSKVTRNTETRTKGNTQVKEGMRRIQQTVAAEKEYILQTEQ